MKSFNPHLYVSMVHSDLSARELQVLKQIGLGRANRCMKSIHAKIGIVKIKELKAIAVAAKIV